MDRISGQMALTCQAGFYYDSRTEECRNCDFVCGDQYGGHEQRECRDTCPGITLEADSSTVRFMFTNSLFDAVVSMAFLRKA